MFERVNSLGKISAGAVKENRETLHASLLVFLRKVTLDLNQLQIDWLIVNLRFEFSV